MRTIAIRLIIAFLCILVFLAAQGILAVYNIQTIAQVQHAAFGQQIRLKELSAELAEARLSVFKLLGTMDPGEMDRLLKEFEARIQAVGSRLLDAGIDQNMVAANRNLYQRTVEYHYNYSTKTARRLIDTVSRDAHEALVTELTRRAEGVDAKARKEIHQVERNGILASVFLSASALVTACFWALILVRTVTDRRQAEKELSEERERLFSLLENLPGLVFLVRADGALAFANKPAREITDGNPAGRKAPIPLPGDADDMKTAPGSAPTNGPGAVFEWIGPDQRVYQVHSYPHANRDGAPLVLQLGIDVTDRKKAEDALRESEEFHRTLFEGSPTPILLQDFSKAMKHMDHLLETGIRDLEEYLEDRPAEACRIAGMVTIVRSNLATVKLFRAETMERLLGGLDRLLIPDRPRHFIDQLIAFKNGTSYYEGEAQNLNFNGETIDLIIRKNVIPSPEGDLSKVLVSLTDVTELYRAQRDKDQLEAQLQQSQKMEAVGTLAGGIAHDFNNLLAVIIGYLELITLDLPRNSPLRDPMGKVFNASYRARDLVQQILTFSRKAQEERKPVDILPVIKESLKFLRSSTPVTIDIQAELNVDQCVVNADPTRIQQVLMNLGANASDAMALDGGILRVSLEETFLTADQIRPSLKLAPGPIYLLSIRDTGEGMDPQTMTRIFEPFFTTKPQGKGTGMGLAVVHGIVQSHEGDIEVTSRPGQGTEFSIYLPKVSGLPQPKLEEHAPLPGGKERVIFVDDEVFLVESGKAMLMRLGYRVEGYTDPEAAVEDFRRRPEDFDLMITDLTMPRMTGVTLAKEIWKIRPGFPIILCTGYSPSFSEEHAEKKGFAAFAYKPLALMEMSRMIRGALDGDRELFSGGKEN